MTRAKTHPSRILAVDDEQAVLECYRQMLADTAGQDAGARALESELFGIDPAEPASFCFELVLCTQADDAVGAVREALDEGNAFALALIDVRMPPGISGIEAAERIRALDPDIRIALVSAYSDWTRDEIAARVPPLDKVFYFEKPFRVAELRDFASRVCEIRASGGEVPADRRDAVVQRHAFARDPIRAPGKRRSNTMQ